MIISIPGLHIILFLLGREAPNF